MKTRYFYSVILLIMCMVSTSFSYSSWKTYASVREVRDLMIDDGYLWVATTGGVIQISTTAAHVKQIFTNVDGLASLDIRTIAREGNTSLIFGGAESGLSWWKKAEQRLQPLVLSSTAFVTEDIEVIGSGAYYLAGNQGISLFINGEIKETYNDFSTFFDADVRAITLAQAGYLWVATDKGVVRSNNIPDRENLALPNLMDPDSWTIVAESSLPSRSITALIEFDNEIWIGTENGIARLYQDAWITSYNSVNVNSFTEYQGVLYATTRTGVLKYENNLWESVSLEGLPELAIRVLAFDTQGRMWLGMKTEGIAYKDANSTTWKILDLDKFGPRNNYVGSIAIDGDTSIWTTGNGAYAISRSFVATGLWENYNKYVSMFSGSIKVDAFGNRWFCTWGKGLYRYDRSGNWHTYNTTNSLIGTGTPKNPLYPVVNDILILDDGSIYIANFGMQSASVANGIIKADTSMQVENQSMWYGEINESYHYSSLAHDHDGNIWVGIGMHDATGVEVITKTQQSLLTIGEANGLVNGYVNKILIDGANRAWIATNSGIAMYENLEMVFGKTIRPFVHNILLSDIMVHDIDYDSTGNIWAATEGEGVYQFDSDGTILAQYTSTNSGLVHNIVNAIAINRRNGYIWLGTINGISRFQSTFTPPPSNYTDLKVFPNPYMPQNNRLLRFEGIILESRLYIYTSSGQLVATVITNAADGMTWVWDGKSAAGKTVAAGLYYYVLYDNQGGLFRNGSFTVIR